MMILNPIDNEVYEVAQKEIGYAKLFPYILEDFVTRKDIAKMMQPANLTVNTAVQTILAGAAGTFALVGTGQGTGTGLVNTLYKCQTPAPDSIAMKATKKIIVDSGGKAAAAAIGSL